MRKILLLVAVAVLVAVGAAYWFVGTPRYSLYELGNAIRTGDYETARSLVDEDRIATDVGSAVTDEVFKQAQAKQESELQGNPFAGLGTALMAAMKPQMQTMVQSQLRAGLDDVLGKDGPLGQRPKLTAGIFERKRYTGVKIDRIDTAGNTADAVLVNLPDDLPTHPKELHIRMAYTPGVRRWRVVGLPDVPAMLSEVMKDSIATQSANGR